MNLSPVYFVCFVLLTGTTDALLQNLVPKVLGGLFSRTSLSLDIFHPLFMDRRNKYQKKRRPGYCEPDAESTRCSPKSRYRTYDGSCNNLAHPGWGRTLDCHLRFLEASYEGDGGLRLSVRGRPLPLPRDLSVGIFLDRKYPTRDVNFLFTVFGQMVAHDISNALSQSASGSCCSPPLSANSTLCAPIRVRPDDPFYAQFNVTCLNMVRSARCPHCSNNGKWQQSNTVTAAVDGSVIYGSTKERAMSLRTSDGTGKLTSEDTDHGELLPRPGENAANPIFCPRNQKNLCFYTGDVRTNQHAPLMSIQTVFMREHNRIADALRELNPHWDDETLYQETRRIVVAELQNIVYSEYLPPLLGPDHMSHYNLYVHPADSDSTSHSDEHGTDRSRGTKYDPSIRMGIWNEFASTIFRFHSMVPTKVGLDNYKFRDFYSCPQLLREGELDRILSGASEVPSEKNDRFFTKDVSRYLLKQKGVGHGADLVSTDIQRGRDHGMPTYADMLRWLSDGEMDVTEFEHLSPIMSADSIAYLEEHYADVRDVDLFTGAVMEHRVKNSNLGPTACAIVAIQFYELKFGDRHYFQHKGEAPSFTPDQRATLSNSSLSRIFCDNTEIRELPENAMRLESAKNPLMKCSQFPKVDLRLWKTSPHHY